MDRFIHRTRPAQARLPLGAASSNSARRQSSPHPSKRRKVGGIEARSESSTSYTSVQSEDEGTCDTRSASRQSTSIGRPARTATGAEEADVDEWSFGERETAIENSLPAVEAGQDVVEMYETLRASQADKGASQDESAFNVDDRKWVRGKKSIYVDAFNLALDTVLEDEAHLFGEKENQIFGQWKTLGYEGQYLYVRLFLRKRASWHRINRLAYHSDISDLDAAVRALLEARELSNSEADAAAEDVPEAEPESCPFRSSFTFADASDDFINTLEEAVTLLNLDELRTLAKEARVQGKNKAELTKAICRMSSQQTGLLSLGLRRESTTGSTDSRDSARENRPATPSPQDSNRNTHFLTKIMAITGPLIRLSQPASKLFERVHCVFYRSTEWTEKSLTTIILAKISRRNFPSYIVSRSSTIFPTRRHLLEFEDSIRVEHAVDQILEFNGPPGKVGFQRVLDLFISLAARWRELLIEEQRKEEHVYEFGEGAYLRRFTATHAYTRVAHKAAHVLGRLHRYDQEHELLSELLGQRLFHPARRGGWYIRKALLEEHYMWKEEEIIQEAGNGTGKALVLDNSKTKTQASVTKSELEQRKRRWRRIAASTCETALQDPDTHLICHYDLQKRLVKLEKWLRIPKLHQHDFGHVRLHLPEEHTVSGTQIVRRESIIPGEPNPGSLGGPSTKTVWLDRSGCDDSEVKESDEVSVEEMCLSWYRSQGWKGYHSEGGILRTLFAYLFFDIMFLYVPNVFQTPFQTCPLDLHSDAFYPARASEINHRLVDIENGEAEKIMRAVDDRERERRTCVVGLNWDFDLEDLVELVNSFQGTALAAVCKVMAEDYKARGGGVPDLVLWRLASGVSDGQMGPSARGEVMFAEVKSANDRLSDTQRLWIHVLTGAGVRVALCNAVAKEVRVID